MSITQAVSSWDMADTLSARSADIAHELSTKVFPSAGQPATAIAEWNTLSGALPQEMTLEELLQFLSADTETEQQAILDAVSQRVGIPQATEAQEPIPAQKRIRILTMHGAKGLSGKVVFIPSAGQGIMPNSAALQATGLLIEQRRLFYVSLTRAMACCIISHAAQHTGAAAMTLAQRSSVRLPRSQFLSEMGVTSVNRTMGLNHTEAARIMVDVNNL
jgi:superfamily I DNA/RNA helicase